MQGWSRGLQKWDKRLVFDWVIFETGAVTTEKDKSVILFLFIKARCWAKLLDCIGSFFFFISNQSGSPLTSSEQLGPTGLTFSWRALTWEDITRLSNWEVPSKKSCNLQVIYYLIVFSFKNVNKKAYYWKMKHIIWCVISSMCFYHTILS